MGNFFDDTWDDIKGAGERFVDATTNPMNYLFPPVILAETAGIKEPAEVLNSGLDAVGLGGPGDPPQQQPLNSPSYSDYPAFPELPPLEPWTGRTRIPAHPGTREVSRLIRDEVLADGSEFRRTLSGDPNRENFNRAVVVPMEQDLVNRVLPMVASSYGATPYGPGFYSGAREEAEAKMVFDTYTEIARLRLMSDQQDTQNMFAAIGQIPGMASVFANHRAIWTENLEREINVHYQNQGLKQQQFQNQVAETQYALGVFETLLGFQIANQNIEYQNELLKYQADQQRASQMWSIMGQIVGTVGGAMIGGPVGATVGGSAGSMVGGNLGAGPSVSPLSLNPSPVLPSAPMSPFTSNPYQSSPLSLGPSPSNPFASSFPF